MGGAEEAARDVFPPQPGCLAGRVAIVTGGGHGLGEAFSLSLASRGAHVAVVDIDHRAAVEVARSIVDNGGSAMAFSTDVTEAEQLASMANAVAEQWQRIDILINNAAIVLRRERIRQPFDEIDEEEWNRVMAVNVKGAWLASRAVVPHMRRNGAGKIVNISSGTYYEGAPFWVHYGVSKAALIGLTRSLARELGPDNICVNTLTPGLVETDTTIPAYENSDFPDILAGRRCFKRRQYPNDLIGALAFLASTESDFITGQILNVDGGMIFH